ncbi:MAG: AAA family ATPase [Anaerolineaceae bacterium]
MDSEKLIISLLGPPLITIQGKPIQIKRRKVRFLMYFLASQEFPVSRGHLCDTFWPGISETEARKNLREALSHLRSAFPWDDYLVIQGEFISLDPTKIKTDIREFEKIIYFVRTNLEVSQMGRFSDEVYLRVREGINLWRTPGFISGSPLTGSEVFQRWVTEKNESLEYWRQMMLEWIADYCISTGNLNEALNWLSQALLHDRHNTELNLLTLKCLEDLGAWSELKHFCSQLESSYQENGRSTLPPLLVDSILHARDLTNNPIQITSTKWEDQDANNIHFVSETNRFRALNNCLRNGGMVLIRGEAGSGKSRLLREFYTSLEVIPRLIFYRCSPADKAIPYQTLVEGFKGIISEEEWKALKPIYAKSLYPLFPFIEDLRPDIKPEDISFAVGLDRLIPESFYSLFKMIANRRRCLVIIDDAQWCDADTLRVLAYVHAHGGPVDIGAAFLASRKEIENPTLDNLFVQQAKNRFVEIVDIPSLSLDEIKEISFILLGVKSSPDECVWLEKESGGNPELLIGILNSLKQNKFQLMNCIQDGIYSINSALSDLIERRFDLLSEAGQAIFTAAAVLGKKFQLSAIAEVSEESPNILESEIRELQQKGLLRLVLGEPFDYTYEFVHGVVYRFILNQISPEKRWLLNLKSVEALKKRSGDTIENSQAIAQHYEAAGDLENAFAFWVRAGEKAIREQVQAEVYHSFGRALEVGDYLGERCSTDNYYRLIKDWADFAFDLDDVNICKRLFSRGMEVGQARNDPRLLAFGESGMAWVESLKRNYSLAAVLFERAEKRFSEAAYKADLARVYIIKGIVFVRRGEYFLAVDCLGKVKDRFHDLDKDHYQDLMLRVAPYLVIANCEIGKISAAKSLASMILGLTNPQTNLFLEIQIALLVVNLGAGNYQEALNLVKLIKPRMDELKVQWWLLNFKLSETRVYLETGDLDACWRQLSDLISVFESDERYRPGLGYAYYIKGEIYGHLDDHANASECYKLGMSHTENQFVRMRNATALSISEYNNGHKERAHELIRSVLTETKNNQYLLLENHARFVHLLFLAEDLDKETFAILYSQIGQQVGQINENVMLDEMLYLEGIKEIRFGEITDGLQKLMEGYREGLKNGNYWLQLRCLRGYIHNASASVSSFDERKLFLQLLENLKHLSESAFLKPKVQKYIASQRKLIKR